MPADPHLITYRWLKRGLHINCFSDRQQPTNDSLTPGPPATGTDAPGRLE